MYVLIAALSAAILLGARNAIDDSRGPDGTELMLMRWTMIAVCLLSLVCGYFFAKHFYSEVIYYGGMLVFLLFFAATWNTKSNREKKKKQ